uniref:Calcineurin-like phosphoesterase domain-containing protein n=1 Tax=Ignisphaera aggregans TaxID=334771 RepID=A0A7C4FGV3_9CREN
MVSYSINVLVISDAHGRLEYVKSILRKEEKTDLIIYCGDIAHYRRPSETIHLLKLLADLAKRYGVKRIMAVPGNIDILKHYAEFEVQEKIFVNLHEKAIDYQGYHFLGFGGSNITPFNTLLEYAEEVIEERLAKAVEEHLKNSSNRFVLVTHVPPHNTMCDKAYNGEHIGSKAIRRVIEYYKPLAVFSGHVHESRCVDKVGSTIVVNPGPVSMGFYSVAKLQDAHVDAVLKQV